MKNKSSRTRRILKTIFTIISIPFILIWLLIILLYIPPVQRFAVNEVCGMLAESTGFDISIGSFRLAFPLKLKITDLRASRNDTLFIDASHADVNVSPIPLLSGEIEVNYVQLEGVDINTGELIPEMSIDGRVGFFRVVARNIDLEKEIAYIRQLHLHSTDLNIQLKDTTTTEEEPSEPLKWIVRLKKANIENCNISLSIPADTLAARSHIGKINIEKGKIDLGNKAYKVGMLSIKNTDIGYDQGIMSAEEAPLSHIEINEINLAADSFDMSGGTTSLKLEHFAFIQPGGIRVTDASADVKSDSTGIDLKEFTLKSKNGSYINCTTYLPWSALSQGGPDKLSAKLSLGLKKPDLGRILSREQYDALSMFRNDMLTARMEIDGNFDFLEINSLYADIPGITSFDAKGYASNLTDTDRLAADLDIECHTGDIRELMGQIGEGAGNDKMYITGNIAYTAGEAKADILVNSNEGGEIVADAVYDINRDKYSADLDITGLKLVKFFPEIPLHELTMQLKADGRGTDLFSRHTAYNAEINIDSVRYADYRLERIGVTATQAEGKSDITVKADDPYLKILMQAATEFKNEGILNSTSIDIADINFKELGLSEAELASAMKLDIEAATDLGESHSLVFNGESIKIVTAEKTYTPEAISLNLATAPDTSYINAKNGDLIIKGTMASGYGTLFKSLDKVGNMYMQALESSKMEYYLHDYEKELPKLSLKLECGQKNMLYNILAMNGITTDRISFGMSVDTIKGLNMNSGIYGFKTGGTNLDTIRVFTRQEGDKIRYLASVRSTALNPEQVKETFSAAVYGNIYNDSLSTDLVFRDNKDNVGIKMGMVTLLMPKGLNISFKPDAILMGDKFTFDRENFLNIGEKFSIDADITLTNSKDAGMHLYTNPDPESKYNANLELFNVNLKDVTAMIPYAPDLAGMLNLDLHYRENAEGMLISCDAIADSLSYEGAYIGNEIFEAVYFPKNDNTHYIDLLARHEEEEIMHLKGNYKDDEKEPGLDGTITMTQFPLAISNAFLKSSGVDIDGFLNCDLSAKGPFSKLNTDGFLQFNSVNVDVNELNASFKLEEERVRITDNKANFKDFKIYDKANNPFKINGTIDFSKLTDPAINLRMNADDYELINSPRKKGAMLYGKLFLDIRSFIRGSLNNLNIFGNVGILGKSNITYVMLDAPIESDKELDGLVEFVNFKDSIQTDTIDIDGINLGNTKLSLVLDIDENARINADFDENRSSYIMLQGGGNLHLTSTDEAGMVMTGTYTMKDGQLKYTLPVIPLKTFKISDGSKITWTGDIADPEIDITALEKITSSVTFEDNSMVPVAFDVGVKLSRTLSNMGLSFTMSAPENAVVQDQLNQLDAETMNKYAVTMLITGAYMGSSKGMTVSNALSSFLDAKINNLAGSAMKSVSVNVGINDAQNAETGGTYKNYSFSFSKRFWNDRLTIVIGGEVNSGEHANNSESFINNVSLEWKISDKSERYLRLFYDKNYKSILEGEITETGVGYIYKRKLNNLKELFIFKKKKETEEPLQRPTRRESPDKRENGEGKEGEAAAASDTLQTRTEDADRTGNNGEKQ